MTLRSVLLGLTGALLVCSVTYYNDHIMRQTFFVGNNMPVSVYGGLILFLLLLNPLLFKIGKKLSFTGKELVVVMAMTLASCAIPGSGLMRTFTDSIMLPHRFAKTDEGWKRNDAINFVPDKMLTDIEGNEDEALNGFIQGMGIGDDHIAVSDVPWSAWGRTLGFWVPVILLLWFALMGLAVVVHRQWAHHEQLAYPVAVFADALLPDEGAPYGSVFKNKLFWGAAAVVVVVHLNNYAVQWFPSLIQLPLAFNFGTLNDLFPTFRQGTGSWHLLNPTVYPTVIAFSYFLATDVSLSLGVGPFFYTLITGVLFAYGVSAEGGGYLGANIRAFFTFGAYAGVVFMLIYTGRRYYRSVAQKAFTGKSPDEVGADAVWGMRVFVASLVLLMVDLMILGLDWPLVILYTLLTVGMFLVMSRIMAETGLFFIQTYWFPCAIISGLMGAAALGPSSMMIMMMLTTVLLIDPRESIMPFVVNSLKLVDMRKVKVGRTAMFSGMAVVLGLLVTIPLILYWQYDRGTNMHDGWATEAVPKMGFDMAVRAKTRLVAQGSLEEAESVSGFSRLLAISPDGGLVTAMVVGIVVVLLFSMARLRSPSWPLHPVMFLIWGTYPGRCFAGSFLIGWLIKKSVTKYGGEAVYRKIRPLMFGLIAGDMLGGIFPSIVGAFFYFITSEVPKAFNILPG